MASRTCTHVFKNSTGGVLVEAVILGLFILVFLGYSTIHFTEVTKKDLQSHQFKGHIR